MAMFSTDFLLNNPLPAIDMLIKEHWPTIGNKTIPIISKTFSDHFDNEQICIDIPLVNITPADAVAGLEGKLVKFNGVVRNNALEAEYVISVDQNLDNKSLWKTMTEDLVNYGKDQLISRTLLGVECASKFLNVEENRNDPLIEFVFIYDGRGDEFPISRMYEFFGTLEENSLHVLFYRPIDFLTKQINYSESKNLLFQYLSSHGLDPKIFSLVLCSRVAQRVEGLLDTMALGNISLCLSKCDKGKAELLFQNVLRPIIPTFRIQIDKENLENTSLFPVLDLETGQVSKTPLQQLVHGSCLLLDECSLEASPLNDCGTKNIRALMEILKDQTIPYDFGYSEGHIPTDIAVIVACNSSKSLLKCTLNYDITALTESIQEFETAAIFNYIQNVRRLNVIVGTELNDLIEKDFIEARKEDPKFYTDDQLHLAISAARTFAAMDGREVTSEGDWQEGFLLSKRGKQ
jgi:hypothetical protein